MVLACGLALGCGQQRVAQPSRAELIEEAVETRLQQLVDRRMRRCRDEAMTIATAYVDSLIAAEFSLEMVDTIAFPNRPMRPRLPVGRIELDTARVRPVLE